MLSISDKEKDEELPALTELCMFSEGSDYHYGSESLWQSDSDSEIMVKPWKEREMLMKVAEGYTHLSKVYKQSNR